MVSLYFRVESIFIKVAKLTDLECCYGIILIFQHFLIDESVFLKMDHITKQLN